MNAESWRRIKDVFAAVAEASPTDRDTRLAELCRDDPELRSEVERLLSQHDEMGNFLEGASPPDQVHDGGALAIGDTVAGRYRIMEFLGSGGMGEVYAAEDLDLGEPIAIKIIRQEAMLGSNTLERLRREVQLARRVTHSNVCRVFDLGHYQEGDRDVIFLTMELIRGETLTSRLKRDGRINSPEALLIATQLCDALDAAHQAGILHRDFKTSNVMLAGEGEHLRAVVTDFGIARLISGSKNFSTATATMQGMVVGTPAYMSPEQLLEEELTVASDIYSLGLVLYEVVTGIRPFEGTSSWTETLKRLSAAPRPPMEIVERLDSRWNAAILRCLQREPAKRFASAGAVARFLQGKWTIPELLASRGLQVAAGCLLLAIAAAAWTLHDRIWAPSLPGQKHVAVLPFKFAGNDSAGQASAYELAESLTANLSRLEVSDSSLWVVPWNQVRNQKPEDASHAASLLGVNLLVTGELKRNGDTVRLLMELKDSKSLRQLRSRTVEISESRIVTLEDKAVEQASSMLQLHVPQEMLHQLLMDATAEPGAYEFYEQGRGYLLHFSQATPEDVDRAIALLQKAIEKDSSFALAYANLAYAYARKFHVTQDPQWLEKAKPLSQHALSLNDKLATAHLALGLIQQDTGDQEGAIHEFEKALQLDPTDDQTLYNLSNAYDDAGRLLQAEALLKDALKRAPGSWVNYNYLGYLYYSHADYPQAEPLFRTATELAPDNALAFYNLGGVYLAEGKYKEAEDILVRAISIRPTAVAYSNLGLARQYQEHYEDAAVMFRKAAELLPADDRLWCNLGVAYRLAGNHAKADEAFHTAIQLAEKTVALRPKDVQALGLLARYYAEAGEKTKARQTLARAPASSQNDPDFLYDSALVDELAGRREQALAALHSALRAGYSLSQVERAHEFDSLRKDQRFSAIAASTGP